MIKFRTVVGIFILLIAVSLFVYFRFWNNSMPILVLMVLFLAVISRGAANIASGMFVGAKCKADTKERVVALSFDDGPSEHTNGILDVLKEESVEAAFFCIGKNVEKYQDILKRIDAEGHIIGNHSYSHHYWFDLLSAKKMIIEFQKTDALIKSITGHKLRLFRPPYGVTNPALKKAVEKQNYTVVGWSLRSLDGISSNENKILARIRKQLKPGSLILLHDSREITKNILHDIIRIIKTENYKIVRPDILLNVKPYDNETKN